MSGTNTDLDQPSWTDEKSEPDFALEDDPNFGSGSIEEPPMSDENEGSGWGALASPEDAFENAGRIGGDQPVPRITITAFCDRPDVASVVQTAAQDRRLTKAIVNVEMGGIDQAVATLSSNPSPNLTVVDTVASASALLRGLDRLAELVDEGSKV